MATNLITNPSAETGSASPWSARSNCTLDVIPSGQALDGANVFRMTSTAAGNMDMHNDGGRAPISASTQFIYSVRLRPVDAITRTAVLFVDQIDSGGSGAPGTITGGNASCPAGTWTTVSMTGTTSATTAALRCAIRVNATAAAGEQWLVEQIAVYTNNTDPAYQGPDAAPPPSGTTTSTKDRYYRLGGVLVATSRRYRIGGVLTPGL